VANQIRNATTREKKSCETIIPSLFVTICIMHHHGGQNATEGYKYIN